ncbi:hypothetical protein J4434_03755 [Candidatus Woesearchaeota archaeon]|nr:hypothetical protein [Candidatus Woesearchaeota archaeon]
MVHNIRDESLSTTGRSLSIADGQHCMADGLFGDLDGIEGARDVQVRNNTLDKLLEVEKELIREYSSKHLVEMLDYDVCDMYEEYKKRYIPFYKEVRKRLNETTFNEGDIASLVLAEANNEYSVNEKLVLGVYTGCLASLLTERNRKEGKRTRIHIDGKDNIFHFLFLFARDVDDIIVENLKGSWICGYIASHNGHANDIIGVNLEGNSPFAYIGSNEGRVNRLVGLRIKDSEVMSYAFSEGGSCSQMIAVGIRGGLNNLGFIGHSDSSKRNGKIEQLIVVDVEGRTQPIFGVGSQGNKFNQVIAVKVDCRISGVLGSVGSHTEILQVIGAELKGEANFNHAGFSGYIHQLYGINIEGDRTFSNLGYYYGKLGTIVAIGVKGKETFHWHSDQEDLKNGPITKNVKKIVYYDCAEISPFIDAYSDNIVSGNEALAEYKRLSQKHHISEIVELAKSMEGKNYQEVLGIADKLYTLQPDFSDDISLHQKHKDDQLRRASWFFRCLYVDAKYYLQNKFSNLAKKK